MDEFPVRVPAWQSRAMPVSTRLAAELGAARHPHGRLACWVHLVPNAVPLFDWLLGTGADVLFGSCDPATADPEVIDHLRERGARVLADPEPGRQSELLADAVAWRPHLVTEMGGELIAALVRGGTPPMAAMESTTTGIHRVRAAGRLPMPVLNWNDTPFKQQVEHRFHVAEALWTAFSALTGIGLLGRTVLVIGYGNVGKGVAERARDLGALVTVAELDPLRRVDARLHGCAVVDHAELAAAGTEIVVTATGRDGALGPTVLDRLPAGAMIVNAGHSPTEIDLTHLARWPSLPVRPGIVEHVRPGDRTLYLLGAASPLNLAYPHGSLGDDLWDPFNGLLMLGCGWLLDGAWRDTPAGFVDFPLVMQHRLAELMLTADDPGHGRVIGIGGIRPIDAGSGHELREVVGAHLDQPTGGHSVAQSTLRPNASIGEHLHAVTTETFVVTGGAGTVTLDGTTVPVEAGQAVVVPPKVRHGFTAGPDGLTLLAVSTPSWSPADHRVAGSAG
jgi:adenosylhomocysteinase